MNISPAVTRFLGDTTLRLQQHAPAILTSAGVVGVIGATILIAKATLKLNDTLDEGKKRLEERFELQEPGEPLPKNASTKIYIQNAVAVVKIYAPGTLLLGASLGALVASPTILHRQNVGLVAAYKGLESAFKTYRDRVVEEYGLEVDQDFRNGVKRIESKDPETGKKVKSIEQTDTANEYAFDFGITNPNFQGFHDQNMHFLTTAQAMMNQRLHYRGHVLLHEVLDVLGIPRTEASVVTGWVADSSDGDRHIDFGIDDSHFEQTGYISLFFNVQGLILDHFKK